MMSHVAAVFPGTRTSSEAALRTRIRDGWRRARAYGLRSERNVALFIDLTFGIGADFDSWPEMAWATEILRNRGYSENAKIVAIYRRLPRLVPGPAATEREAG